MVEVPDKPITHVYFVETGVVSVVAVNAEDHRIEVGVIGNEGMTGVPLIMGDDRAQHSAYMQIGGNGQRIPAEALCRRDEQERRPAQPDAEIRPGLHDPDGAYRAGQWPRQAGGAAGALAV